MIVHYLDTIGMPILDFYTGETLGLLQDIIVRPEDGKIEAFWVRSVEHPFRNLILQTRDIVDWKQNVYIKSIDAMTDPSEVVRIRSILEQGAYVIGNRVYDEENKALGRAFDLDFDPDYFLMRNLYAQKQFLLFAHQARVFSAKNIIQITPERIVVQDLSLLKSVEPQKEVALDL